MSNLLGLSLDVGAIGWTLIDSDSKRVKDMGTYVFPVGSENYGSGNREVSKNSLRTLNRSKRMGYSRKRRRKNFLIKLLVAHEMCPLKKSHIHKEAFKSCFQRKEFVDWMKLNPYQLRAKAVNEEISLHELGRIYYHILIRRGFPFGKRNTDSKTNTLFTGIPHFNRLGIRDLERKKKEETLGQYFNSLLPPENVSYKKAEERIRNRFVNREMYIEEAHIIWNKQTTFHTELNEELRNKLIGSPEGNSVSIGAVFFQKPLRSQKHKVGKCTFEPNKSRCAISNLVYQDLLAYKWINTIKKNGGYLSHEESEKIYRFFMANSRFKFSEIKQLLGAVNSQFNKKNSDVIYGSSLNSRLSREDLFGMDWFDLPFSKRKDIWHALSFFNNSDQLQIHAQQKWGLGELAAQKIAKLEVNKRYAPISEKAAKNILYFLKRGVSYQLSIVLGGVKNSLSSVWDNIEETDIQFIINRVVSLYRQNVRSGFLPKLKEFLIDEMQFSDFQIKKLYGLQVQNSDFTVSKKFPYGAKKDKEINDFKNPLLKNTLFQARKIINSVVDKYGTIDEIKVELNTNLKTNKFQRYIYRLDQKRVANNRYRYINRIGSLSENITQLNLLKMELWEECSGICPYSGEPIPLETLFTDNIKVVNIHPWSKSLNDSSVNKTLCYSYFAERLDENSPYEFFSDNPEQWEKVVDRAADLFSNSINYPANQKKFRKFVKRYYQRNYIKNQLDDPNFVSREVACLLSKVCVRVSISSDYTTDHMIHAFSLDKIIDPTHEKFRYRDHRNYGLKSYIVAIRDNDYLKELSIRNKYSTLNNAPLFPIPHDDFRNEVNYFINNMLVAHKKQDRFYSTRKVNYKAGDQIVSNRGFAPRGSLHRDSMYGKRTPPNLKTAYHIRKPLESIRTMGQVEKIVDVNVKNAVLKVLKNANLSDENTFSPQQVFFKNYVNGSKKTKVFLPNKNGDPVPVNKVRIREALNSAVKLKKDIDQYVNLRKNHHVLIYRDENQDLNEEVVSFWEAIKRIESGASLYQLPNDDCEMVTALHINDMFLMGVNDLKEPVEDLTKDNLVKHLYRVQKLSSRFYEFRQAHNNQLDATEYPNYIRINNFGSRKTGWSTYQPLKVEISPIGDLVVAEERYLYNTQKLIL
ncbi:hypothetical protein N9M92_00425 [Flavobacteriaceae bacterium]|nr:hypothetical protein [Flavobacteriaceae bacterium]